MRYTQSVSIQSMYLQNSDVDNSRDFILEKAKRDFFTSLAYKVDLNPIIVKTNEYTNEVIHTVNIVEDSTIIRLKNTLTVLLTSGKLSDYEELIIDEILKQL